jgi:hypothetical protein
LDQQKANSLRRGVDSGRWRPFAAQRRLVRVLPANPVGAERRATGFLLPSCGVSFDTHDHLGYLSRDLLLREVLPAG